MGSITRSFLKEKFMFLTIIKNISLFKKTTQLADPDKDRGLLHSAIEQSLNPHQGSKFLFRYDKRCRMLIISSEYKPSSNYFYQFFEVNKKDITIIENYEDKLFKNIEQDKCYKFYLEANAITRNEKSNATFVKQENLNEWIDKRASDNGFVILRNTPRERYGFPPTKTVYGKKGVPIYTADFKGTLKITDIEKFQKALTNGVGRSKTYGCGLLWINEQ